MKRVLFLSILLTIMTISSSLEAHPHVYIDSMATIVFDTDGVRGIEISWVFDEMFSSMIIHDYDKGRDGILTTREIEKIERKMFSNLKEYGYFTHIRLDNKRYEITDVEDFTVTISSNCVIYNFFIPCVIPAVSSNREIRIAIYDETYYTYIELNKENPVRFKNGSLCDYTYRIVRNTKEAYYFGQVFPQEIVLEFKKHEE